MEVMKESMRDVMSDDKGKVRFGRAGAGGKPTKRGKVG